MKATLIRMAPVPQLFFCATEYDFQAICKRNKFIPLNPWIKTKQADATTHLFGMDAVVCMDYPEDHPFEEVLGMLVHEAVHIWQNWCDHLGEHSPGAEQEAYAVQAFSQALVKAYMDWAKQTKDFNVRVSLARNQPVVMGGAT